MGEVYPAKPWERYCTKPGECGAYRIVNQHNDSMYVGVTTQDFWKRWEAHRSDLNNGQHRCPTLQQDWDRLGGESFQFEIIECITDPRIFREREQYWLDHFKEAGAHFYNRATKSSYHIVSVPCPCCKGTGKILATQMRCEGWQTDSWPGGPT
jgi:group I intron endonuclease